MDNVHEFEFEIVNADDEKDDVLTPNSTITDSCKSVDASDENIGNNKKEAIITDKKDFEVQMVEDDSTLNNNITGSYDVIDATIEDVRNNKKTLVSTMDLVIGLMRQVECEEKAAEQAKAEAVTSGLDVLEKAEELKQAQQRIKDTNDKHAKEVYARKKVLATEMNELQFHLSGVLNEGGTSVGVLDELRRNLEKRLTVALRVKELADKEKLEKELSAQKVLAYEESQMKKVAEESERLKQEAVKNSKLQEFLKDRSHVVEMLDGDISDKCRDVKLLKESLDQAISLSEALSSSQMLSIIASSGSSLTTENSIEINEQPDSHAVLEKSFGSDIKASTDDNVKSTLQKEMITSSAIVSSGSTLTNDISNERNEETDSHVVLTKPFIICPDAENGISSTFTFTPKIDLVFPKSNLFSPKKDLFPKISDLYLEKQEGNKNVAIGAGEENACYSKFGRTTLTKGCVASGQNFNTGETFQATSRGSAFIKRKKGTRKYRRVKKTDH